MAGKQRKANWTAAEVDVLVNGYLERHEGIIKKHDGPRGDTEKMKAHFLKEIQDRVNSVSFCSGGRSTDEITKKWKDLKSQTKKREQLRRKELLKTGGGGPPTELKDWEKQIIQLFPDAVLEGLKDGVDIFKNKTELTEVTDNIEDVDKPSTSIVLTESAIQDDENEDESDKTNATNTECRKTKRSLQDAQLDFYQENTKLCKIQQELAKRKIKVLDAQESFYKAVCHKLTEAVCHKLTEELENPFFSLFEQ